MSGLLDFLQAASNTAASTVSGPVDLIGMLLRKAGVPVPQDSLGSSEWMKQKGLMQDVPQSAASLAGETFGLLSPVVAAAKAPQIAGGLLKMGENAAAPRTLNPQTGAIVWHGSPHKFDKFDSSKIGTGEGAQAYGHGLYLAESPKVAESYQHLKPIVDPTDGGFINARAAFDIGKGNIKKALAWLDNKKAQTEAAKEFLTDKGAREFANIERARELLQSGALQPGNMYKVDLPDSAIARMLDWDAPLSRQAPEVQKALAALDPEQYAAHADDFDPMEVGQMIYQRLMNQGRDYAITAGRNAQTTLPMAQAKAADDLRAFGIPGIRYLDGGSRGAGSGTSNYVIFPQEEGLLTILERNGVPLR